MSLQMPFISASFGKASSAKEAGLQRTVRLQPGVRVRRYFPRIQVTMGGIGFDSNGHLSEEGNSFMLEAVRISHLTDGIAAPHPRSGCVLVSPSGQPIASAFQTGQGGSPSEVLAVEAAGEAAKGATAFLNLEPRFGGREGARSDGAYLEVQALVQGGIKHAVIGLRHPLPGLRGNGIRALRDAGIQVEVLGEAAGQGGAGRAAHTAAQACALCNEALLHRVATGRPMSTLKYAMTLDGKIAASSGHSAWVSCAEARERVFQERARSDAVVVGGNTARRDGPRLTTRREGGHVPMRVVMSRSLDLPLQAALWDTSVAPTVVLTQRGARRSFQKQLQAMGVEVVEFDFLHPGVAADYLAQRGCLQVLWECGGMLAAPAVADAVIHKVMAFVCPKLIGGQDAPTPLNSLGFVEMTQSLNLEQVQFEQVNTDMLVTGYLPSSGGLGKVAARVGSAAASDAVGGRVVSGAPRDEGKGSPKSASNTENDDAGGEASGDKTRSKSASMDEDPDRVVECRFYKAWDTFGALSNFAPYPVSIISPEGVEEVWPTVEHYYQAQKFWGVDGAEATLEAVKGAPTPELAAWTGRRATRVSPLLQRPDWDSAKLEVMMTALRAKFTQHQGPRELLLETSKLGPRVVLMEDAPHDYIWGVGEDGSGKNHLGVMLSKLRDELLKDEPLSAD